MNSNEFAEKVKLDDINFSDSLAKLFDLALLDSSKIRKYLDKAYLNTYDRFIMEFHADYSLLFIDPKNAFKTFKLNIPLPKKNPSIHFKTDTYYLSFRMQRDENKKLKLAHVNGIDTILLKIRKRNIIRFMSNDAKLNTAELNNELIAKCYDILKEFISYCSNE